MITNWLKNSGQWLAVLNTAELKYGIPKDLLARQCYQESGFNAGARNPSGAVGLMQLLPKYFPGAGRDGATDIQTAAKYLSYLYKRFSRDWQLGLAAYDWGPSALEKWIKGGRHLDKLPIETHNYVSEIIHDVPIGGSLCRTQSPQVGGDLQPQPSPVQGSEAASPTYLFSALTKFFTRRVSTPQPMLQPLPSVTQSLAISSQTAAESSSSLSTKESSMSTTNPTAAAPSPALVAASPFLKTALTQLKTAVNTTLVGDPMQIPLRAGPAFMIFLNQLALLEPSLAAAETGVINTTISNQIDGLIAKLP